MCGCMARHSMLWQLVTVHACRALGDTTAQAASSVGWGPLGRTLSLTAVCVGCQALPVILPPQSCWHTVPCASMPEQQLVCADTASKTSQHAAFVLACPPPSP